MTDTQKEYRAAVEAKAREIWDKREQAMWGDDPEWQSYRKRWEQGSERARDACLDQAERELGQ